MTVKSNSLKALLVNAAVVVVLLALLTFLLFHEVLPFLTNKNKEVTVPDLTGMSLTEATTFLQKGELDYVIGDSSFRLSVPSLSVLSQFPKAGSRVKVHRKIVLTLNATVPPLIVLPEMTNSSYEFVCKQLSLLDLKMGKLQIVKGIQQRSVTVLSVGGENLRAGDRIPKGSIIDIVLEMDSTRQH